MNLDRPRGEAFERAESGAAGRAWSTAHRGLLRLQRLRDITDMDVSSEDEESHSRQEEESDREAEDGHDTGSQASEGSPPAKTGAGPRGSRARRWFP